MRNQQAGGVVSFIIIAVALTGLLVGGLYLSKNQGRAARNSDTSTPQVTAPAKQEQRTEKEPTKEPAPEAKPAPTPAKPAPQTPATSSQRSATGQQTTPQNRVANTGPSDTLPATGPAQTSATFLALAVLTFASYRFILARRDRRAAALGR